MYYITAVWNDTRNRKKFFEDYAKENGFDPLVPENWYNQPRDKINTFKVIILNVIIIVYILIL